MDRDEEEGRRAAQGCLSGLIIVLAVVLAVYLLWILR